MKILTIVGARPQFVKAAVLSRVFRSYPEVNEVIVHTGQHFDPAMSGVFFEELEIPAASVNLGVHSVDHCAMIGRLIERLGEVYREESPDMILVYGDTNSTLAASVAGKKSGIPIVHVEAGIRTGDEAAPEESNRYLVDRMATLNFCCTWLGMENLRREGHGTDLIKSKYFNHGDVMKDATIHFMQSDRFSRLVAPSYSKPYLVVTIHRPENTDDIENLREVVSALNRLAEKFDIVFPVHPRTAQALKRFEIRTDFDTMPPVGYLEMLNFVRGSAGVITDSGGLVREAYFLRTPSVLILGKPAWPELITNHACIRVDCNAEAIMFAGCSLLGRAAPGDDAVFGDGDAGRKIVSEIFGHFG